MEKGHFFEYRDWVGLASFLAVVSSFHIYFRGNKKSIESIDDMVNHGSGSSPGDHLLPLQQSYRRVVEKKFADGRVNGTGELENVEILLHNISHKDFILSLSQAGPEDCIARPEFNHYNAVCEDIYSKIRSVPLDQLRVIYRNVEHRARMEAANKSAEDSPFQIPVGIHIPQIPEPLFIEHAKLRRRDKLSASEALSEPSAQVLSAFIPLIALLIPKWLAVMDVHTSGRSLLCQKVLVLVSGEGASITDSVDNSTRYAAMIVKLFISRMYPELNVILIHSTTNVFRYDENIVFVKNTLVPQIEYFRNVLAQRIGAKWRDKFHLTLSLADGASARVSAINASLRSYHPSFMHFWQLKSFYTENRLYEDDIEYHSYEEILTSPAIHVEQTNRLVQDTVRMMRQFIADFESSATLPDDCAELSSFWLRKTKKPVLAVLMVQAGPEEYRCYRGTNMEVSMPTGSLCAERNVIGTALADNLSLTRKDFRYLAVYSFPSLGFNPGSRKPSSLFPDDGSGGNSLQACPPSSATMAIAGSSTRSLVSSPSMRKTVLDRTESWTELDYPDAERKSLSSPRNCASTLNRGEDEERKLSVGRSNFRTIRPNQLDTTMNFPSIWSSSEAQLSLLHEPKTSTTKFDTPLPPPGIPPRPSFATWRQLRLSPRKTHPVLAPQSNYSQKTTFVKTVTVEECDMNPLKPCGACLEWLKKIAEVNPEFTILTFTDVNCEGIYLEQIDTS